MPVAERKSLLHAVWAEVELRGTSVALNSPDHGPRHWRDVARMGLAIYAEGVEVDLEIMCVFALLHDSQRINEWDDPHHGERAAKLAGELYQEGILKLDQGRLANLYTALTFHDQGETSSSPAIGACWDADRLTLWRVGQTPAERYMSMVKVKERFEDMSSLAKRVVTGAADPSWEEILDAYAKHDPVPFEIAVDSPQYDTPDMRASYALMRQRFRGGELHPELQSCVVHRGDGPFGRWICHKLIHMPYMDDREAAAISNGLEQKKRHVAEARADRNWSSFVFLHERPYRLDALLEIEADVLEHEGSEQWADLVGQVWTDSENIHEFAADWQTVLEPIPYGALSDDEEREALHKMPDELTVYRGTNAPDGIGSGFSWTLAWDKAEWFAKRLLHPGRGKQYVIEGRVRKTDVLGYLTARGESEIVALPDNVRVIGKARVHGSL